MKEIKSSYSIYIGWSTLPRICSRLYNHLIRYFFTFFCVSPDPAFGSMYLDQVATQLEDLDQIPESTLTIKIFVTHLVTVYPTDFPNVQTGMRSIITGYVERNDLVPPRYEPSYTWKIRKIMNKPTQWSVNLLRLANYDIKILIVWYCTKFW